MIDAYFLAWVNLAGSACTVLGGLYLAYDLVGGPHGPLRTLTRVVTYSLMFAAGYAIFLGLVYGLIAGFGLGLALGLEYWRIGRISARGLRQHAWEPYAFGFMRGIVQGIAATLTFGPRFGVIFGLLSAAGLVLVYRIGFSVAVDYILETRPRLSRHRVQASVARGLVIGAAGAVAGLLSSGGWGAVEFGLKVGLVVGLVSALVGIFSPIIEYWADHLPERHLGAFGIGLSVFGFILLSIQYLAVILHLPVQ